MKQTVLLLLILSLLLSLAACGDKPAGPTPEPIADPSAEVGNPVTTPAPVTTPDSPVTPANPADTEPPAQTPTAPASEAPVAVNAALGMTAEAFVAAYNKTASDAGRSNQITGFSAERAVQTGDWFCVTATVEVGTDSKVAQVMQLYMDGDGGLGGVELLISAGSAVSGSDLSDAPDDWESFKGTLGLIAQVLGSKENKVVKQAKAMDEGFSYESEGVVYDYSTIGAGICYLKVYSAAAGSPV